MTWEMSHTHNVRSCISASDHLDGFYKAPSVRDSKLADVFLLHATDTDKVKQFPRNPVFVTFIDHQLVIDWVNQRCFGHDLFLHLSFLIFIVLIFNFKFRSSSPLTINHSYKSPRAEHKKPQFHACTFILPLFCNLSVVKRFHLGNEYSPREIEVILRLLVHITKKKNSANRSNKTWNYLK